MKMTYREDIAQPLTSEQVDTNMKILNAFKTQELFSFVASDNVSTYTMPVFKIDDTMTFPMNLKAHAVVNSPSGRDVFADFDFDIVPAPMGGGYGVSVNSGSFPFGFSFVDVGSGSFDVVLNCTLLDNTEVIFETYALESFDTNVITDSSSYVDD